MKRIGTVSSAMGFIFLGVWMILEKTTPKIAEEAFKYWPILFIILGVEIIIINSRKREEKIGFNPLIVFVILIYLFVNGFQFVTSKFFTRDFNINPFEFNIDNTKYKSIEFYQTIKLNSRHIVVHSNNININVKKSNNKDVLLSGKAYFNENTFYHEFKPKVEESNGILNIYFDNNEIKKVDLNIQTPENIDFDINSDILNIDSDVKINEYKFDINNGKISIKNVNKLNVVSNNIDMDANEINMVNLQGHNGNINIVGKTEELKLNLNNGKININNNSLKNFWIKLDSGVVNLTTKEKNIDANLNLNSGVCKINGENRVNSGLKKVLGTGGNKVYIELDNGVINLKNVE